jgi:hypothetical protein
MITASETIATTRRHSDKTGGGHYALALDALRTEAAKDELVKFAASLRRGNEPSDRDRKVASRSYSGRHRGSYSEGAASACRGKA